VSARAVEGSRLDRSRAQFDETTDAQTSEPPSLHLPVLPKFDRPQLCDAPSACVVMFV